VRKLSAFNARLFLSAALAFALLSARGAAGADAPPVRVGIIFSYAIIGGAQGRAIDAGMAAWVKEHGDTVGGRKVELIRRDDGGMSPDNARRLAQELIVQDHVDLLAGITFTPNAIAAGAVSTAAKKPLLIINAATSNIMAKNPYMSRFGFTTAQMTVPLAKWMLQTGLKTAIAVYQDYGPGIEAANAFQSAYTGGGGTIVDEVKIPVNNLDYSAYVQRIKDAHAQAAFVFINASGGGIAFVKAARTAGLDKLGITLVSPSDVVDENDLDALGDQALGLIASSNYAIVHNSALNRQFSADFRSAYALQNGGATREPTSVAVTAYDVMHAISNIVAAQGDGPIDPDRAMTTLRGMKFESPRGPVAIDPDTRGIVQNVYIRRVQRVAGKLRYVEIATSPMVKDPLER
jgi:branched-chain amino acid transport system substrate-binding protein